MSVSAGPKFKYLLIGTELSLFTAKVRSFLRFKKLEYEEILSTNLIYKHVILQLPGIPTIPCLIEYADDSSGKVDTKKVKVMKDTHVIMDYLEQRYPVPRTIPSIVNQNEDDAWLRFISFVFESFSDDFLVIPAMHWRWNKPENRKFLSLEFGISVCGRDDGIGVDEIFEFGQHASKRFNNFCKPLGITDQSILLIEEFTKKFLKLLSDHLQVVPFMLGWNPSWSDFCMMGSLYAHLSRDPVPGFMIKTEFPLVFEYIERVTRTDRTDPERIVDMIWDKSTNTASFVRAKDKGLLNQIPPTLKAILQFMLIHQLPIFKETLVQLTPSKLSSRKPLPRSLGMHEYKILDRDAGKRGLFTFNAYLASRLLESWINLREFAGTEISEGKFISWFSSSEEGRERLGMLNEIERLIVHCGLKVEMTECQLFLENGMAKL
ncbi:hypothetical protein BKA69DRAFT_1128812 [Paraphysoderma sedebokerense]|nr:hypothetical protein BKA69DRAFT_1128812 [Paraphysoderma sedebokerense]